MPFRFESGGPAYLGKAHEPFVIPVSPNVPRFEIPNLSVPAATAKPPRRAPHSAARLRRCPARYDRAGVMEAMDHHQREAVALMTGMPRG